MLSLVLDPLFASNRYVYLVYSVMDTEITPTTFLAPSTATVNGVIYTATKKPKWYINQHDILVRITLNSTFDGIVPGSPRRLLDYRSGELTIHHGGWMGFNPAYANDASKRHWLHVALGKQSGDTASDADKYDSPHCLSVRDSNGVITDKDNYLGKLLRIDVSPALTDGAGKPVYVIPAANPIWSETIVVNSTSTTLTRRTPIIAKGLRNPWRGSFDQQGALWLADVGNGKEEINRIPLDYDFLTLGGLNFGKDTTGRGEGYIVPTAANGVKNVENPLFWTPSGGNGISAIIGGFIYRGSELPDTWKGRYLFGGHNEGLLALAKTVPPLGTSRALYLDESINFSWFADVDKNVSGFAEDDAGEIHLITIGGALLRLSRFSDTVEPVVPSFTSLPPTSAAVNVPFTYDLTVSGTPEPNVTLSGPSWLAVSKLGSYAWSLQGTPPAGTSNVNAVLTATNSAGTATQTVALVVTNAQLPSYALTSTAVVAGGVTSTYFDTLGTTDTLAALDSFTGKSGVDMGVVAAISTAPAGADVSD